MPLESINPYTGEQIANYEELSDEGLDRAVGAAHLSFIEWRRTSFATRRSLLKNASSVLRSECDDYARLMAEEMGKPILQARAEVEKCARVFDFYAEKGEEFLADRLIETDASKSFVCYGPLGVVLAVMPWNFPFWQVCRFAAPALMAGNSAILKHSSNVSACSIALEGVFRKAGFPEGLFLSLLLGSSRVEKLIEDRRVAAVTLTGSTPAGRAVAAKAGECIKKTVLELGGSDPYVILEDADLESAARLCVESRLLNAGQSCIAAKRLIVPRAISARFTECVLENMKAVNPGDPFLEDTTLGPLARHDLRDELHSQVRRSVEAGATLLLGGEVPEHPGALYPPTLLSGVAPGIPAYEEELFGPVASIIEVKDEDDALRVANDTEFGLAAAVFTSDIERGERIARGDISAGACFVNTYAKSDPRLPFGGIKKSGYGRELSDFGIREFVNAKTVYVS